MNDRFATMMNMQSELQEKYFGGRVEDMEGETRIQFVKDMKLALESELQEAIDEIGWKPWASSKHFTEEAFKAELIDAWHFMMNLFLVAHMEPEDIFERYMRKHDKNIVRQTEGYDGVSTKCGECKRALDDDAVTCHPLIYKEGEFCCHFDVMADAG